MDKSCINVTHAADVKLSSHRFRTMQVTWCNILSTSHLRLVWNLNFFAELSNLTLRIFD